MIAALILSLITGGAPAPVMMPGFVDAPRLLSLCKAEGPDAKSGQAICLGYVIGVVDQLMVQQSRRDGPRRRRGLRRPG